MPNKNNRWINVFWTATERDIAGQGKQFEEIFANKNRIEESVGYDIYYSPYDKSVRMGVIEAGLRGISLPMFPGTNKEGIYLGDFYTPLSDPNSTSEQRDSLFTEIQEKIEDPLNKLQIFDIAYDLYLGLESGLLNETDQEKATLLLKKINILAESYTIDEDYSYENRKFSTHAYYLEKAIISYIRDLEQKEEAAPFTSSEVSFHDLSSLEQHPAFSGFGQCPDFSISNSAQVSNLDLSTEVNTLGQCPNPETSAQAWTVFIMQGVKYAGKRFNAQPAGFAERAAQSAADNSVLDR